MRGMSDYIDTYLPVLRTNRGVFFGYETQGGIARKENIYIYSTRHRTRDVFCGQTLSTNIPLK